MHQTPPFNGENVFGGATLRSDANDFIFPENLPFDTADRRLLLATPAFAAHPGGFAADFGLEIPANFFALDGDTIIFEDTVPLGFGVIDSFSFGPGELPTDGLHALRADGTAVIGGHIYRGSLLPQLESLYAFGDLSGVDGEPAGRLFVGDLDTQTIAELLIEGQEELGLFLFGIGTDAENELYVLGSTNVGPDAAAAGGVVMRMVPEPAIAAMLAAGAVILLRRRHRQR